MKLAFRVALILAAGLMAAGVAGANSLDRAGTWVPSDTYTPTPPGGVRSLINDGSFELGPPPGSAWSEVSTYPCEWIGNWASAWGVGAFDGSYDYWGGGYCYDSGSGTYMATSSSVTQSVLIPTGATTLSFYYLSYRPDPDDVPPDGDHGYLAINGIEWWTLPFTQANDSYPSWAGPILIDVSAYVGQTVSLSFGGTSVGSSTGNIRFDFIELTGGPTPVLNTTWGAVKSVYR